MGQVWEKESYSTSLSSPCHYIFPCRIFCCASQKLPRVVKNCYTGHPRQGFAPVGSATRFVFDLVEGAVVFLFTVEYGLR